MEDEAQEVSTEVAERIDTAYLYRLHRYNRLSFNEIATKVGLTAQAIHQRLQRFTRLLGDPEERDAWKEHRGDILQGAVMKLVAHAIDPKTLRKASTNNAAFAARQFHEMYRLETNQSTQNLTISSIINQSMELSLQDAQRKSRKQVESDKKPYDQSKLVNPLDKKD